MASVAEAVRVGANEPRALRAARAVHAVQQRRQHLKGARLLLRSHDGVLLIAQLHAPGRGQAAGLQVRQQRARIGGLHGLRPGARAHAIPGAGHWVAYEAAHEFNATLLRFLTEQP